MNKERCVDLKMFAQSQCILEFPLSANFLKYSVSSSDCNGSLWFTSLGKCHRKCQVCLFFLCSFIAPRYISLEECIFTSQLFVILRRISCCIQSFENFFSHLIQKCAFYNCVDSVLHIFIGQIMGAGTIRQILSSLGDLLLYHLLEEVY